MIQGFRAIDKGRRPFVWVILISVCYFAGGCATMSRSAIRPGATGRVVDSVSGQPLAGAEVVLEGPLRWDKGVYAASSYTGNAHTVTDKDGKFTIDPLMGFGYRAYTIQSANGVLVTTSRVNVQMIGYLSQHVLFSTDVTSDVGTIQLKHR